VARLYGVRRAMPMFKALAACPEPGRPRRREQAMDKIRNRLGEGLVRLGRDPSAPAKATLDGASTPGKKRTG
jgi:nucleotidyltransferase/DNA polymerase involved in DNA repair